MAGLIEMTSNTSLNLGECRLYGILDLGYVRKSDATHAAEAMIKGGVDLIQLRGKNQSIEELVELAAELHELTAQSFTPLIVNDHAEVASKVPVGLLWLENQRTALARLAQRSAKAPIILDSVRFSRRRPNPIIDRSDSKKLTACISM
jgi:thiamine monophosphate synthase